MLLNYLIFAIILAAILKYNKKYVFPDTDIILYICIGVVCIFIINKLFGIEGMMNVPARYELTSQNEDQVATAGLGYDYDMPKYPLLQKGQFEKSFLDVGEVDQVLEDERYNKDYRIPGYYISDNCMYSKNGIPLEEIADTITISKFKDLYNQTNFNLIDSPQPFVGTNRGYINWDKTI